MAKRSLQRTLRILSVLAVVAALALTSPAAAATPTIGTADSIEEVTEASDYSWSRDAPVLRLYQAFFDRAPDLDGAKYWLAVRRQGFDALQIAGFMAASQEFQNAYSGTTNAEFTERVYTNVLGRDFDQEGYDYWLGLLNSGPADGGLNRSGMVFYVTDNDEFRNSYSFGTVSPLAGTSFEDGIRTVPVGVYVTNDPGSCYWARLSGVSGSFDDTIQNNFSTGFAQMILEVMPSDAALETSGCGTFRLASDAPMMTPATFGGGDWFVGAQAPAGRYVSTNPVFGCYWQRSSGFGASLSEIVANDFTSEIEQLVVDVKPTDAGVTFGSDCGDVRVEAAAELATVEAIPPGQWIVGSQVLPGTYSSPGPLDQNPCVFRRLSSFDGEFDSILSIDDIEGPALIEIIESDVGFSTTGCQPWTRID